jgi:DNA topoisomerase-1
MHPPARAARAARLLHGRDDRPGYVRRGSLGRFHFVDTRGRRIRSARTLLRIKKLVIPPAWTAVWINPQPRGHLQACGRDARGRKQYLYHPDWRAVRDAAKFDSLVAFAQALPRLHRAVRADLRRPRLDRARVSAIAVRLLETSLIRIGNDEYVRRNGSYGLTTLRDRHATIARGGIHLRFRGKSGRLRTVDLSDRHLARLVRRIQELPGQELFRYRDADGVSRRLRSDDVNAYLREHTGGDFTAKDFRTWGGTVLAALELAQHPPPESATQNTRTIAAAVRVVADRLGNTPAIARQSYIHPAILEAYSAGRLPRLPAADTWPPTRPRIPLAPEERAVLRILRAAGRNSR